MHEALPGASTFRISELETFSQSGSAAEQPPWGSGASNVSSMTRGKDLVPVDWFAHALIISRLETDGPATELRPRQSKVQLHVLNNLVPQYLTKPSERGIRKAQFGNFGMKLISISLPSDDVEAAG